MRCIGKIMRSVDAGPIRAALALVRGESASETAKLHRLEKLRTDLLADEKVLHQIATLFPSGRPAAPAFATPLGAQGTRAEQATAQLPRDIPTAQELEQGTGETQQTLQRPNSMIR